MLYIKSVEMTTFISIHITFFDHRNGTVFIWNKETGALSQSLSSSFDEALCVDMTSDVIIAGSRNGYIKLWSKKSEECKKSLTIAERVWSIQISPSKT